MKSENQTQITLRMSEILLFFGSEMFRLGKEHSLARSQKTTNHNILQWNISSHTDSWTEDLTRCVNP